MEIPRYWRRVAARVRWAGSQEAVETTCWGWSDVSEADALRKAERRAAGLQAAIDASADRYPYPTTPIREEILERIPGAEGLSESLITENSYGAAVLNTDCLFIADIDAERPRLTWLERLKSLFSANRGDPTADQEERLKRRLEEVASDAFRLYRTAGGWRVILVSRPVRGVDEETLQLLELLEADPLYIQLCRRQASFRARLTPKPWRVGVARPAARFPRDAEAAAAHEVWRRRYRDAIRNRACCRRLRLEGESSSAPAPELLPLLYVHDQWTRADTGADLA